MQNTQIHKYTNIFSFKERRVINLETPNCTIYENGTIIDQNEQYCTQKELDLLMFETINSTRDKLGNLQSGCGYIKVDNGDIAVACSDSVTIKQPTIRKPSLSKGKGKNKIDFSKIKSFNDHFKVFDENSLKSFSIDEWESRGYTVTVEEQRDDLKLYHMEKNGNKINVQYMDKDIVRTEYKFPDGESIRISHLGMISYENEKGESVSIYAQDYNNNDIASLLNNDALLLSKKDRTQFLSSLSTSEGSIVNTNTPITTSEDGILSQNEKLFNSGKIIKNNSLKAIPDIGDNSVTFVINGEKKMAKVLVDDKWGDPYFDNSKGLIGIPLELEEEALESFK